MTSSGQVSQVFNDRGAGLAVPEHTQAVEHLKQNSCVVAMVAESK